MEKIKLRIKTELQLFHLLIQNISSKKISKILVNNNIATRNDNFYAWRCLNALGINTEDGVVRLSLTHYNTKNDVDKAINALETIR